MLVQKFTDLEVWKQAHQLTLLIYRFTKTFPKFEIFGLSSQLRRASVSVESCIAEGFSRYHYRDRLNFYYDARGSLSEIQSQAITAKDLKYLSGREFSLIFDQAQKTLIILSGLIKSTERMVGSKGA